MFKYLNLKGITDLKGSIISGYFNPDMSEGLQFQKDWIRIRLDKIE
jgi:hypothetical protein